LIAALDLGEGFVEVQPDSARKDSNGDNDLVAAIGHTERHDDGVGALVNELIRAKDLPLSGVVHAGIS
jgi:hypothetical protein